MLIYRFKLTFEEQDDFVREIELGSSENFETFHQAIAENLGLDMSTLSSFFITDNLFRKRREISLIDMSPEVNSNPYDEEKKNKMLVMKEAILSDYIDDPHQKLLYIYDYLNYWTFRLELLKILPAEQNQSYPRIVKMQGEVPHELITNAQKVADPDIGLDLGFEEDQYDPEDIRLLHEDDFLDEDGDDNFDDFDFE